MRNSSLTRKHPMKRGGPIPRKARTPIKAVNRKRKASEFARCYHSKERVEFVKALHCVACGFRGGDSDNAHVCDDGSKGAGRKSGYRCIAPLCRLCHRNLHANRVETFEAFWAISLEGEAARVEAAWQAYSHSRKSA